MNQQALSFERNARNSPYASGGLGVSSPRVRSSSFSGIGSSPLIGAYPRLPLLSNRIGTHSGSSLMSPLSGLGNPALQRERLRSQTRALEAEALRREHRARSLSRERAVLAAANERLLTPRMSPRFGQVGTGVSGLMPAQSLARRSSWHGAVPVAGSYGHSPRLGYARSPRLAPLESGLARTPALHYGPAHYDYPHGYRSRSSSASRILVSPGINHPPSPRVVNYHNTYNLSPRLLPGDAGLGAFDDLSIGMNAADPLVLDEYGRAGGVPAYAQDFVVTDASLVDGRRILRDFGPVEGLSGFDTFLSEDERLNLAISDLTARAHSRGANAVLSVETGEDIGGQIVVRGVAALLS
ncbi:hypothetical protein C6P46_004123 [Rhodotorula mucilaginosa]|uniref:Uncharacterized protein n=1 Tax=Rhodotorula mucilaginosa TaxID=5537 RepID=A0A9P6W1K6_RHOMI|nr:hypothetical protein C6P46_004123 [Rhodotorula mucilaginosa]